MDVSVVMINYNTFDFAKDAINSIIKYTKDINYEIILVDNASPDGSGVKLKEKFKNKIVYVDGLDNLGTSKGFNLGCKYATGKYVLWLNTDILIEENFIFKLFSFMEKNDDCGICGGNVYDFNHTPVYSYTKYLPSLKTIRRDSSFCHLIYRKLFKKKISYYHNYSEEPLEVGFILGADMMIRKSLIDKLNGFDEDIFMYSEESEFTFRASKEYKSMSVPDAKILHLEGASFAKDIGNFGEWRFKIARLGDLKYFAKCYGIKAGKKYLKLLIKRYNKMLIVSTLLFQKDMKMIYKKKKSIIQEYLSDYPNTLKRYK